MLTVFVQCVFQTRLFFNQRLGFGECLFPSFRRYQSSPRIFPLMSDLTGKMHYWEAPKYPRFLRGQLQVTMWHNLNWLPPGKETREDTGSAARALPSRTSSNCPSDACSGRFGAHPSGEGRPDVPPYGTERRSYRVHWKLRPRRDVSRRDPSPRNANREEGMSCAAVRLRAKARSPSGGGRWASGEEAGVSGARALRWVRPGSGPGSWGRRPPAAGHPGDEPCPRRGGTTPDNWLVQGGPDSWSLPSPSYGAQRVWCSLPVSEGGLDQFSFLLDTRPNFGLLPFASFFLILCYLQPQALIRPFVMFSLFPFTRVTHVFSEVQKLS
jgi:hypothetical protein